MTEHTYTKIHINYIINNQFGQNILYFDRYSQVLKTNNELKFHPIFSSPLVDTLN